MALNSSPVIRASAFINEGSNYTTRVAQRVDLDAVLRFDTVDTFTAAQYEIGQGTDIMQLNVPSGKTFTLSVAGTAELTLSASDLDLQNNTLSNVAGSGNDFTSTAWTLTGTGGKTIKSEVTSGSGASYMVLGIAASSTQAAQIFFTQGDGTGSANNMEYVLGYVASQNYLSLYSRDTDGSSADADIFRVADGGEEMILNANHGTNFDYVCDGCGKASVEVFQCCGQVEWHDDTMALVSMSKTESGLAHMVKIGVMETSFGPDGTPWVGVNLQRSIDFSWSALRQNRQRMDAQYDELNRRLEKLEAA